MRTPPPVASSPSSMRMGAPSRCGSRRRSLAAPSSARASTSTSRSARRPTARRGALTTRQRIRPASSSIVSKPAAARRSRSRPWTTLETKRTKRSAFSANWRGTRSAPPRSPSTTTTTRPPASASAPAPPAWARRTGRRRSPSPPRWTATRPSPKTPTSRSAWARPPTRPSRAPTTRRWTPSP